MQKNLLGAIFIMRNALKQVLQAILRIDVSLQFFYQREDKSRILSTSSRSILIPLSSGSFISFILYSQKIVINFH